MLVKATKERCRKCKYLYRKSSERGDYPICNYLGQTGEFRSFKNGKMREDLKPGYCDKYKKLEDK